MDNNSYQHILKALDLPFDFTFLEKTKPSFHKNNKWNLFCSNSEYDNINDKAKDLENYTSGYDKSGKHRFISFNLKNEKIKIKTTGSRKGAKSTQQKENAVALITQFMLDTGITDKESVREKILDFTDDLESKRIFLKNNVNVSELVDYIINSNGKNFLIAYNSAKSIYDVVLGSDSNNTLEVHRESKLFDKIKKKAKKLYKFPIKTDKWNPSDIFILKSDFEKDLDSFKGDIYEYNELIQNEKNPKCWGVSLKSGVFLSLQGSAGLGSLEKYIDRVAEIKTSKINVDIKYDKNHDFLDDIEETVKRIFKKYNYSIIYGKSGNFRESFDDFNKRNKKDEKSLEVFASNWNKMLSFLAKYSDDLVSMINYAYNYAHSTIDISCPHWKVYGNEGIIEKVENNKKNEKVQLVNIRVYLNGSTAIFFDIQTCEGKTQYAIKERDKGSIQFEIYNAKSKECVDRDEE